MAHFPPNLEDGEKWLPSDIYQEIGPGSCKPKALTQECMIKVLTKPIKSALVCSSQVESFDHGGNKEQPKGFSGNSGGTGVFLPQSPNESNKLIKGTGVFLQSFTSKEANTIRQNKKCGNNRQVLGKMFIGKKETPEKKEMSQISSEICLPQEWNYELSLRKIKE
ncbi:uncharacterized protein LOC130759856 [Actinidia eriantha]|uniref:uncharacterized protein LOC130759856 n=1 Tax=Actinidia eriantha TaxID=165200 RepID=UPI0025840B6D|nr:uncharacterized protein LOC130759856 [Actinidia eriantha]